MDLTHPQLQSLLEYWQSKRGARTLPLRSQIDPLEFRFALGNVLLVEAIGEQVVRFRYRLWGVNLTRDYGIDMTGQYVDELQPPDFGRLVHQAYLEVAETRLPQMHQFDHVIEDRWFTHQRLLLPLGTDVVPDKVGMILGAIYGRPKDGAECAAQDVRS